MPYFDEPVGRVKIQTTSKNSMAKRNQSQDTFMEDKKLVNLKLEFTCISILYMVMVE